MVTSVASSTPRFALMGEAQVNAQTVDAGGHDGDMIISRRTR